MPYALLAAALVAVDQLVKYLVLQNIPLGGHVPFIPHLVELTYVQNTGAASQQRCRPSFCLFFLRDMTIPATPGSQARPVLHRFVQVD